jgi:hypothetical protein
MCPQNNTIIDMSHNFVYKRKKIRNNGGVKTKILLKKSTVREEEVMYLYVLFREESSQSNLKN